MSSICNLDVGCDTYNLIDQRDDGSVHYFIRKICKDADGNVTTTDYELDGSTEYVVEGTVVTTLTGSGCTSVVVRELWDLNPKGKTSVESMHCATPFLQHIVYDCEGDVERVYNTERDGLTHYEVAEAVDCNSGGIPSLLELAWPPQTPLLDPTDNDEYKKFILRAENPETHEIAEIYFETEQRTYPESYQGNPPCRFREGDAETLGIVAVNAPLSSGGWRQNPGNNSRFTFTLSESVRQMSSFRLEFYDLDTFEGVWGLEPWPQYIVDSDGRTDTFEVDESVGAIHPFVNNITLYAYYFTIPDQITHLYRNVGGGFACHAASFTGYTYKSGPCCDCCGAEELEAGFKKMHDGDPAFVLPPEGYELVSARVHSLRGVITVVTGSGTSSTLPQNTEVSWDTNGSKASLGTLTITTPPLWDAAEVNISWVGRKRQ